MQHKNNDNELKKMRACRIAFMIADPSAETLQRLETSTHFRFLCYARCRSTGAVYGYAQCKETHRETWWRDALGGDGKDVVSQDKEAPKVYSAAYYESKGVVGKKGEFQPQGARNELRRAEINTSAAQAGAGAGKGGAQCNLQDAALESNAGMHAETAALGEGPCMAHDKPQRNEKGHEEEIFELFRAKIGYLESSGTQNLHNKYQAGACTQHLRISQLHPESETKMSTAAGVTKDKDNATAETGSQSTGDRAPKRAKIKHGDFRGKGILIAEEGAVISDHEKFYVPRKLAGRMQFMHLLTREIYDEIPPGVARERTPRTAIGSDTGVDFKVEHDTGMATWAQAWPGDMRPSGSNEARLIFRMRVSNPWKKAGNALLAQYGMVTVSSSARNEEPLGSFGILVSSDGGVKLCKPSDGKGHATSIANEAGGPPRLQISWTVPVAAESSDFDMQTRGMRGQEGYRIEIDIAMLEHAASHALGFMDRRFAEAESAGKMAYYNEVCHINQEVRDFISDA